MSNNPKSLRIVFAGTPDISATVLNALIQEKYNIVGVFTQPDRAKGRGKKLEYSPVKACALTHNIPVFQPLSFKKEPEVIKQLADLSADVMVVIAYGLLLPKMVLETPKQGCINIHVSLLPKWRGAAPIQRAIEAGDNKTGITIMQMDVGLDTGDILHVLETPILDNDTSLSLHNRLAELSVPAVCTVLKEIAEHKLNPQVQPEGATYAHKLTKEEGLIHFNNPCKVIDCKVRAFTPWPSAYMMIDGEAVKFTDVEIVEQMTNFAMGTIISVDKKGLKIQAQDGVVNIGSLQFPGKKMLSLASILNGKDLSYLVGKVI
ncbi:methionyl-tRNA formyltransferase [Cysteiniphilum halobium]|uniref:methionyl-tRNA formyltransferase n=1 Tax=Cysteiniphilum halobium TaxID=2219059 RepID=UPI000E64824F|nr:methionyl-tRNA formyltransferase [Cysteiniphilum halobium]